MFTTMDLMIVVFLGLAAAGMLSLAVMFLVKNEKVRRVCLWAVAALGAYVGYAGYSINFPGFGGQAAAAVVLGLVALAALVMSIVKKDDEKYFRIARIMASVALVGGMANAFFI